MTVSFSALLLAGSLFHRQFKTSIERLLTDTYIQPTIMALDAIYGMYQEHGSCRA